MLQSTKHKLSFGFLNLLFLGISIAAGVTLVRQSQEVRSRAQEEPNVTIIADSDKAIVSSRIAVVVEIDSVNTPVGYVYMNLSFNPHILTAIHIEPGPFFDEPKINTLNYDNATGQIIIDLESGPGNILQSGEGDVAIIIFEAKAPGNGEIIAAKSHVSINNEAPSIIEKTAQALITITE